MQRHRPKDGRPRNPESNHRSFPFAALSVRMTAPWLWLVFPLYAPAGMRMDSSAAMRSCDSVSCASGASFSPWLVR